MSELSDIATAAVQERQAWTGTPVFNVSTGASLVAEIETNLNPLELPVDFMADPRNKVRVHVTDFNQARSITVGDQVSFSFNGRAAKFIIIQGYAESAGFQSKFIAAELASGKDVT